MTLGVSCVPRAACEGCCRQCGGVQGDDSGSDWPGHALFIRRSAQAKGHTKKRPKRATVEYSGSTHSWQRSIIFTIGGPIPYELQIPKLYFSY